MTLGLGIFLSSLFLGTIFLFFATKDRWNWKKIILWPLAILVVTSGLFYAYVLYQDRPKVQNSFWEIPLNATKADVKFMKGDPTKTEDDVWRYIKKDAYSTDSHYLINFAEDKVWAVSYYSPGGSGWKENLQGIYIGNSVNSVRETFGTPSRISVSDDGLQRIFTYSRYNLLFDLEKNKVIGIGIYSPEVAKKGLGYRSDKATEPNLTTSPSPSPGWEQAKVPAEPDRLRAEVRERFFNYYSASSTPKHKAWANSSHGPYAYAASESTVREAVRNALNRCTEDGGRDCKVTNIDGRVPTPTETREVLR